MPEMDSRQRAWSAGIKHPGHQKHSCQVANMPLGNQMTMTLLRVQTHSLLPLAHTYTQDDNRLFSITETMKGIEQSPLQRNTKNSNSHLL